MSGPNFSPRPVPVLEPCSYYCQARDRADYGCADGDCDVANGVLADVIERPAWPADVAVDTPRQIDRRRG